MGDLLVTGGTGRLGAPLVAALCARHRAVRAPTRPILDLTTGVGLEAAVEGVDTVVHCASSPFRRTRSTDVDGTRRLVQACSAAEVRHLVYISIVGIDRVPIGYYRAKLEAEHVVEAAPIGWSILRATQFHPFLAEGLSWLPWTPLLLLPRVPLQPVDTHTVVGRLVRACDDGPGGRLPDLGGPEVVPLPDLVRQWLTATRRRRAIVALPPIGTMARAVADGALCCAVTPGPSWSDWLAESDQRR